MNCREGHPAHFSLALFSADSGGSRCGTLFLSAFLSVLFSCRSRTTARGKVGIPTRYLNAVRSNFFLRRPRAFVLRSINHTHCVCVRDCRTVQSDNVDEAFLSFGKLQFFRILIRLFRRRFLYAQINQKIANSIASLLYSRNT